MKSLLLILTALLFLIPNTYSQSGETVSPTFDIEFTKKASIVALMTAEGNNKIYLDCLVHIKNCFSGEYPKYTLVEVAKLYPTYDENGNKQPYTEDSKRETVFSKKFENLYVYIYSNGSVQVGKPNFNTVIMQKDKDENGNGNDYLVDINPNGIF